MKYSIQPDKTAYACYLTYFMSGVVILSFGAIMPELIIGKGLSYTLAGGLLTCLTIGNFLATVLYPALCVRIKEKYVTTSLCFLYPICLFLFTVVGKVVLLYVLILLIGLNRGIITLTNNRTVNAATNNSPKHLNFLHMSYALGALLSPFLIAILTRAGIGWETLLRAIALITFLIPIIYLCMDEEMLSGRLTADKAGQLSDVNSDEKVLSECSDVSTGDVGNTRGGHAVSKSYFAVGGYYLALGMIFSYMGLENTVNGWFETYLQQTGIMSETLATMMVSITWLMIMIGRLVVAKLTEKVGTTTLLFTITAVQFVAVILLLNAHTAASVVIALVLFGLGLAGIYPTLMAYTGRIVNNANLGMSVLTGIGTIGGMVLPQLIGIVADARGFSNAIVLMLVNSIILVILGFITIPYGKRKEKYENREQS